MDEFYVNCALKGDVNISCIKITKKYYDDNLKSCLSFFPLPVVKISSGCNSCYAQLRVASSLYKKISRIILNAMLKNVFLNAQNLESLRFCSFHSTTVHYSG